MPPKRSRLGRDNRAAVQPTGSNTKAVIIRPEELSSAERSALTQKLDAGGNAGLHHRFEGSGVADGRGDRERHRDGRAG